MGSGPPVEDEDDHMLPSSAAVVPVSLRRERFQSEPRNMPGLAVPDHALALAE